MISSASSSVSSWASSLFSKLDTSNKGYLSQSDLSSAFSQLGSADSTSSSSAEEVFNSLDSNKDGKITEDELSAKLQSLADELNSQYDSSRMAGAMSGGTRPPRPPGNDDEGLTEDQLTSIASTTTDSKLAGLMNNVASNFSAADSNGDGKVTRTEAMAYQQSSSSTAAGTAIQQGMPPPAGRDSGFTLDELQGQLKEIGDTDSRRSSFISNVVSNFTAADTDSDGKVSFAEAQTINQSTTASSDTTSTSTASNTEAQVLMKIMQLLQAYGTSGQGQQNSLSNQLSISA